MTLVVIRRVREKPLSYQLDPVFPTMESDERPSKSQRKRDMTALQETGEQLVALSAAELTRFGLPEQLLEAVVQAQRIRDFEGRRRQIQYIGRLMREVDAAPIRARLDEKNGAVRADLAVQRLAERWRERLLDDDAALAHFSAEHPRADRQRLRALLASVRRDRGTGKSPRNYRELYRALRDILTATSAP